MTNIAATEEKYADLKDTKFDKKTNIKADRAIRELDRVKRWKKMHDLLRENNRAARKEQDKVAKDCASVREEKLFSRKKTKVMGLRFGVAIPPTTWNALITADMLVTGKSDLAHPDKEEGMTIKASNQIVKDLGKAFPQYRVS